MKVQINKKEYNFELDGVWGAIYLYEEVTEGKLPFNPSKTKCLHILFWCILMLANKDFDVSFEEFMTTSLNDLDLAMQMMQYYHKRMAMLTTGKDLVEDAEASNDDKKKD